MALQHIQADAEERWNSGCRALERYLKNLDARHGVGCIPYTVIFKERNMSEWVFAKSEALASIGDVFDKLRDEGHITIEFHNEISKKFESVSIIPAGATIKTLRMTVERMGHALVCDKGPGGPVGGKCTCGLDETRETLKRLK